MNKHLQVKVRWDFNKKSTPSPIYFNKKSTTRLFLKELRPKSFVDPRHISEVTDKELLEVITVVNYFLKVSMIVQITVGYNPKKS